MNPNSTPPPAPLQTPPKSGLDEINRMQIAEDRAEKYAVYFSRSFWVMALISATAFALLFLPFGWFGIIVFFLFMQYGTIAIGVLSVINICVFLNKLLVDKVQFSASTYTYIVLNLAMIVGVVIVRSQL